MGFLSGVGVSLLPTFMVGNDLQAGRLQAVLTEYVPSELNLYALYLPNHHLSAKVRVFIDWAVTNYLQDPKVSDGRYAYHDYPQAPKASETKKVTNCSPDFQTRQVYQYGAEYLLLQCRGDQTLHFEGSVQVDLVPTEPHSGRTPSGRTRAPPPTSP